MQRNELGSHCVRLQVTFAVGRIVRINRIILANRRLHLSVLRFFIVSLQSARKTRNASLKKRSFVEMACG